MSVGFIYEEKDSFGLLCLECTVQGRLCSYLKANLVIFYTREIAGSPLSVCSTYLTSMLGGKEESHAALSIVFS